jgi:titin
MTNSSFRLATAALLALLAGCDGSSPTAPANLNNLSAARVKSALGAPSGVQLYNSGATTLDVYWTDNASAESGFEVHRSTTGPTGSFTLRATVAANVTAYRDTGIDWTLQYCYEVRATQTKGRTTTYSAFAAPACTTPVSPELQAPSGLTAVPTGSTAITLSWTQNNTNATGFHVERSLDGGSSWTAITDVAANAGATAGATDAGRTPEVAACYRVEAFNSLRTSTPSNIACATPLAAPTGFTAAFDGSAAVRVAWSDNSASESGYAVMRGATSGGPFDMLAALPANATTYADHAVAGGHTYWYYVVAIGGGGSSGESNHASVDVPVVAPPALTYLSTFSSFEGDGWLIDVDWQDESAMEDGYRVERSLDGGATWSVLGTVPANQSAYGDDHVPLELRPCYRVIAFNAARSAAPSPVACAPTPAPPSDVSAIALDPYTIQITWTDNSSVEDGFCAQVFSPEEGMWSLPYQITGPNVTMILASELAPETTMWIRIGASSGYGCGMGGEASATTPAAP